jgi:hypothetical protein
MEDGSLRWFSSLFWWVPAVFAGRDFQIHYLNHWKTSSIRVSGHGWGWVDWVDLFLTVRVMLRDRVDLQSFQCLSLISPTCIPLPQGDASHSKPQEVHLSLGIYPFHQGWTSRRRSARCSGDLCRIPVNPSIRIEFTSPSYCFCSIVLMNFHKWVRRCPLGPGSRFSMSLSSHCPLPKRSDSSWSTSICSFPWPTSLVVSSGQKVDQDHT